MPEAVATPTKRVEHLGFSPENSFAEAKKTLHYSFLRRGKEVQELFMGAGKPESDSTQQENDLSWYASFATMDETPSDQTLKAKLLFTDPDNAMRMIVIEKDGQIIPHSFLKKGDSATIPSEGKLITLETSNGKYDGHFRFVTTDQEVIDIPEQDFLSLYSYTHQDSLKSALVGAEAQVADAVFAQMKDPSKTFDLDQAVLVEAVKASGQISTEPIVTCIRSEMPKKALPQVLAAGASAEDTAAYELKKSQAEAYNAKLDTLVGELENHAIATSDDLSGLLALFGEDQLRDGIDESFKRLSELREKLSLASDTELRKGYQEEIGAAELKIKEYQNALETITDPKKLEILFDFIWSGKLSPEAAQEISGLIADGKVGDAMKKMAQENLASMSEEQKEKISQFLGQDVKDIQKALGTAGGAGLIILILLIISGIGGAKN